MHLYRTSIANIAYPILLEVMKMNGCCKTRSFFTKEERIEMLREHKDALEKEAKGVGEKIKELQEK